MNFLFLSSMCKNSPSQEGKVGRRGAICGEGGGL